MSMTIDLTKNRDWASRVGAWFDSADLNKNGYLTIDEPLQYVENLKGLIEVTDAEMVPLRERTMQYWGAIGLVPGVKLIKSQFLENFNRFGNEERGRKSRNEKTILEQYNNAFFDVMDINNDGFVTLEELETLLKACSMSTEGAKSWHAAADINKDGKLDRDELNKVDFNHWFNPDLDVTKGKMFEC